MKREVAERLATIQVEELRVEDAQLVIRTFLREIARCPVCDGSGHLTWARPVHLTKTDQSRRTYEDQYVAEGTESTCPLCGDRDPAMAAKGDPAHVAWVCRNGDRSEECRRQTGHNGHSGCGWMVVLPLESDE